MIFGSVCSGIEAASVAWYPLGWRAAWLSEIEPFPCDVLAHHYPDVPNLGDMTTIADYVRLGLVDAPDVLVGGTPCQAFSVAGLRGGLSDARGQLTLEFVRLADEIDRKRNDGSIVVWENVPGVLSSKDNAFGCFLAGLAGASVPLSTPSGRWPNAGFIVGSKRAIAWRVLDAQFFGVAQRRRRVFVVASSRAGFDPAKILFEFDSVRRNTPPSREARQKTAGTVGNGAAVRSHWDEVSNPHPTLSQSHNTGGIGQSNQELFSQRGAGLVPSTVGARMVAFGEYAEDETASCMKARDYKDATDLVAYGIPGNWIGRAPENGGNATEPMHNVAPCQTRTDRHGVAYGFQPRIARNGRGDMGDLVGALTAQAGETGKGDSAPCVAFQPRFFSDRTKMGGSPSDICHTLSAMSGQGDSSPHVATGMQVRRLTPTECERLQGFPDGYTLVPVKGKPAADGPRYKALGNSMAVPCMRWIGEQIVKQF